ncbi:hypothetical protein B0H14DRAFT_3500486 [Mycena olivaceomarginata]|nr:hypothetical protein B0H14DRAFT_3500486 [Mycena olivaceomarginata]
MDTSTTDSPSRSQKRTAEGDLDALRQVKVHRHSFPSDVSPGNHTNVCADSSMADFVPFHRAAIDCHIERIEQLEDDLDNHYAQLVELREEKEALRQERDQLNRQLEAAASSVLLNGLRIQRMNYCTVLHIL